MGLITQDQFKAMYPEIAGNKHVPKEEKRGDGSRYGRRHKKGQMNATETEYSLILESRLQAGEIKSWEFEREPLQLVKSMVWLPDFEIIHLDDSKELVDVKVKATVNQTTIAKMKIAKHLFPQHRITMEVKLPKNSGWKRREFK